MGKDIEAYTDTTPIPFGQFKNTELGDLPDWYCRSLLLADWIGKYPALNIYLVENEELFKKVED